MTPDQLAAYIAYLRASVSPLPQKESDNYIYLRGFNGGMEHALGWLERNVFVNGSNPLTGEVEPEPQDDGRIGEYRP